MDYIDIGSNGFAQLGDINYHQKVKVEMPILIKEIKKKHPIPEKFQNIMRLKVQSFPHDLGTYYEIVLSYNDNFIYNCENEDEIREFWDFVNEVERFDLESEEITQKINKKYEELFGNEKEKKDPPYKLRLVS